MSDKPTSIDSREVHELAAGESRLFSCWYGDSLRDSDTVASATAAQTDEPTAGSGESNTLTVGSARVNSGGTGWVNGVIRAISTVVQFRVTVPSTPALGDYVVTCTSTTTGSDILKRRCRIRVV